MFRKNTASQFIHFQGIDASTGGIKSGVTWTVRRCIDGTFAAATGTATEDGTTGWYKFAMSQADTNGNNIGFNFTGTGAVPQTVNIVTDGSPPDVNLKNAAGTAVTLDSNNVLNVSTKYLAGTALTGRDIGASVLLSAGSGAGQLDFTSGVVKANLAQILGTALTETAGLLAGGFKKFFNVSSPTGTLNSIPDVVPGSAGSLVIAGTNTPITFTGSGDAFSCISTGGNGTGLKVSGNGSGDGLKATGGLIGGVDIRGAITGNLNGAVSGAVGSVTGAVGSVTGNVGGNVVGSVASVTGNVGGNVVGSVASVTAGVTVTTNNDKTGYALTSAEENAIADALLARNVAGGSSAGRLVKEALYTLRNKVDIAAGTLTVYAVDDVTPAYTATVTTAAGNPISTIDPA